MTIVGAGLPAIQDRVTALLDDFEPLGIEERGGSWRAFFPTAALRDRACVALRASFEALGVAIDSSDVPDEPWAARSQANLTAVRIGRLTVAPPWDLPADDNPSNLIVIVPSMGFGTGHHPSTRLCLQVLQQLPLAGRTVLDLGTGSGVLAIAAARLGATRVVGIDVDPDALACAHADVLANDVADRVDLRLADLRTPGLDSADLVLANLTGALVIREASRLVELTRPKGSIVVSGFTSEEEEGVAEAFRLRARQIVGTDREANWTCFTIGSGLKTQGSRGSGA